MLTDFYCCACSAHAATYDGDLRTTNDIEAKKFHFPDGSQPQPGDKVMWKCPGCHKTLFMLKGSVRADIRQPKTILPTSA